MNMSNSINQTPNLFERTPSPNFVEPSPKRSRTDNMNDFDQINSEMQKIRRVESPTNNSSDNRSSQVNMSSLQYIQGYQNTILETQKELSPKQKAKKSSSPKSLYPNKIEKYLYSKKKQTINDVVNKLKAPSSKSYKKDLEKMRAVGSFQEKEIENHILYRNSGSLSGSSIGSGSLNSSYHATSISPTRGEFEFKYENDDDEEDLETVFEEYRGRSGNPDLSQGTTNKSNVDENHEKQFKKPIGYENSGKLFTEVTKTIPSYQTNREISPSSNENTIQNKSILANTSIVDQLTIKNLQLINTEVSPTQQVSNQISNMHLHQSNSPISSPRENGNESPRTNYYPNPNLNIGLPKNNANPNNGNFQYMQSQDQLRSIKFLMQQNANYAQQLPTSLSNNKMSQIESNINQNTLNPSYDKVYQENTQIQNTQQNSNSNLQFQNTTHLNYPSNQGFQTQQNINYNYQTNQTNYQTHQIPNQQQIVYQQQQQHQQQQQYQSNKIYQQNLHQSTQNYNSNNFYSQNNSNSNGFQGITNQGYTKQYNIQSDQQNNHNVIKKKLEVIMPQTSMNQRNLQSIQFQIYQQQQIQAQQQQIQLQQQQIDQQRIKQIQLQQQLQLQQQQQQQLQQQNFNMPRTQSNSSNKSDGANVISNGNGFTVVLEKPEYNSNNLNEKNIEMDAGAFLSGNKSDDEFDFKIVDNDLDLERIRTYSEDNVFIPGISNENFGLDLPYLN